MGKKTEYSVRVDGIFLTPLTESVRNNGIFLTASVDAVRVRHTCLRVWPCLGRRVGARAAEKFFSKNMDVILRLCRARWYIHLSILSNV